MSNWRKYAKVCSVHGDTSHYVEYWKGDTRLRLTTRGTWSADDGDIYWPSKGCAYYQLEQASEPMTEAKRIEILEEVNNVLYAEILAWRHELITMLETFPGQPQRFEARDRRVKAINATDEIMARTEAL